ncbi:MAG: 2-oxoacid:acceptor oxidoreductase subunit alpha [Candidatus Thorarchaeota archaeon]
MEQTNDISILIGGEAGAGISAAGVSLAKVFMRGGLHIFGTVDYPSLIRGGHNFYMIRAATEPVYSQWDYHDLIIALDSNTLHRHWRELKPSGGILYDSEDILEDTPKFFKNVENLYPIPLNAIVKTLKGQPVIRNIVALGAALGVLGYNTEILEEILKEYFSQKGETVVDLNLNAARMGHQYVLDTFQKHSSVQLTLTKKGQKDRIIVTGNEAVGLGAIAAGCKFYAAYPMTPASPLLHFLIAQADRFNMVTIQAESEIAAINMAIGASYAGVRSMTATSGGGFCLMSEAFSLAGMIEAPLVLMLGQRTGPSTGLPTYTAQSDLRFAIHASHGEFPRVVIAPGDVDECFELTIDAFNIADEFQIPVILLTDKHLIESHTSTRAYSSKEVQINRGKLLPRSTYSESDPYLRHRITPDGISPRLIPGTPGATSHTDSAVHKESGFQGDDCAIATKMADKRYQKLPKLLKRLEKQPCVKLHGPKSADLTLVGWGSTKGVALEVLRLLEKDNIKANFLQIIYLTPFPTKDVELILKEQNSILIEGNQTAQLGSLIKEHTGIQITKKILRYDGRAFNPLQLKRQIEKNS